MDPKRQCLVLEVSRKQAGNFYAFYEGVVFVIKVVKQV